MTKREIDNLRKRLDAANNDVTKVRDELRDIEGAAGDLAEVCDKAEEAIDAAIEALSELV